MIDLKNTKINCVKEDGTIDEELVKLYTEKCKKQGAITFDRRGVEQPYLYCTGIFSMNYSVEFSPLRSGKEYFDKSPEKEIFAKDLKQTKTSFEKIPFNYNYEAVKAFELDEIAGGVYFEIPSGKGDFALVFNTPEALKQWDNLYRKTTITLTPLEAAKNACEEFLDSTDDVDAYASFEEFIDVSEFDADVSWDEEFIKVMRVTLEAYDSAMKGELL